ARRRNSRRAISLRCGRSRTGPRASSPGPTRISGATAPCAPSCPWPWGRRPCRGARKTCPPAHRPRAEGPPRAPPPPPSLAPTPPPPRAPFLRAAAPPLARARVGVRAQTQAQPAPPAPARGEVMTAAGGQSLEAIRQIEAGVLDVGYAVVGPDGGPAALLLHG